MASDARRRLATAGSWATCASLRTATPSAALWASPCSRAWVSRGRPCAAPMPVCCCGACRLPTRREVTRRWPLGLSRSAVYPSTQPSCTSTRRDAPCWGRHFVTRAVSVTFGCRLPRRTGPELDAAQLGSRRAPSAKMKTKHKLEVSGPTMHLAHAYPGPEITHACTREPTIAAFSTWTHQAARLAVSCSRRGVHTHTHMRPRRRLAAAASRRVGAH